MRDFLLLSAMLTGMLSSALPANTAPASSVAPNHPSLYEENRLDRPSQLALDASLSDVVLVATIRGVTTLAIPVDKSGNAFLDVPIYDLEVQRTLKGNVSVETIKVMGGQHDSPLPAGAVGADAAPLICFLRAPIPLPDEPTPVQRARSQHYQFMKYGMSSNRGYLAPPPDSLKIFETILTAAASTQAVEHLAATAEVVLVATVAGGVQDCGLKDRRRYCQEARVTEVYAGDVPESLLRITSHFMRGIRAGSNLLFLHRLEGGTYRLEGASAGALWLDDPAQPGMKSKLGRVRELVARRQDSRR